MGHHFVVGQRSHILMCCATEEPPPKVLLWPDSITFIWYVLDADRLNLLTTLSSLYRSKLRQRETKCLLESIVTGQIES